MEYRMFISDTGAEFMLKGPLTFRDHDCFFEIVAYVKQHKCLKECILNFNECDFVDSAGLGMICILDCEKNKKTKLYLKNVKGKVKDIFNAARFYELGAMDDTITLKPIVKKTEQKKRSLKTGVVVLAGQSLEKTIHLSEKQKNMKAVQKAGVVVLSEKSPEKIALLHQEKYNDITFPKGHIEQGETAEECAIRETKEETGIDVKLVKDLGSVFYINKTDGLVEVHFFLGIPINELGAPEKGAKVLWTPVDKVEDKLTYSNLKEFFKSALKQL